VRLAVNCPTLPQTVVVENQPVLIPCVAGIPGQIRSWLWERRLSLGKQLTGLMLPTLEPAEPLNKTPLNQSKRRQ